MIGQFIVTVWLGLPTYRGASVLYERVFMPLFVMYEEDIDVSVSMFFIRVKEFVWELWREGGGYEVVREVVGRYSMLLMTFLFTSSSSNEETRIKNMFFNVFATPPKRNSPVDSLETDMNIEVIESDNDGDNNDDGYDYASDQKYATSLKICKDEGSSWPSNTTKAASKRYRQSARSHRRRYDYHTIMSAENNRMMERSIPDDATETFVDTSIISRNDETQSKSIMETSFKYDEHEKYVSDSIAARQNVTRYNVMKKKSRVDDVSERHIDTVIVSSRHKSQQKIQQYDDGQNYAISRKDMKI